MEEKAIDEVTIRKVLDRAKVGRSTFYLHYRRRLTISLLPGLRWLSPNSAACLASPQIGSLPEAIRKAVSFRCESERVEAWR
ncbi:MAG: hypothetical protein ABSF22_07765 [Bryobacteraceae bacterium]